MRLGAQADALEVPVRVALTATAALPVRLEICRRLGLRDPEVVIGDFDRPHIELSARRAGSVGEKHRELERTAGSQALGSSTRQHTRARRQRTTCSPRQDTR
jgi:ATP-dependent DNA helicase RecQ